MVWVGNTENRRLEVYGNWKGETRMYLRQSLILFKPEQDAKQVLLSLIKNTKEDIGSTK